MSAISMDMDCALHWLYFYHKLGGEFTEKTIVGDRLTDQEYASAYGLIHEHSDLFRSNEIDISGIADKQQISTPSELAAQIIERGETFDYIYNVWQKRHHGDENLGKLLLLSLGTQSASSTKGIHVVATGKGGYGKSDGIKRMGELIPPDYFKNGGMTPQSLYYSETIKDATIIGLDDVVWISEIGVSVKRITSDFQDGGIRLSVDNMKSIETRSAKRLVFWVSCVDNQSDEQLSDRFVLYEVEASIDRRDQIISHMERQDEGLQSPADSDYETEVCRCLISDLKKHLFYAVIPFASNIKLPGDPRAYSIFSDMIKSSAVWHYKQRELDDKEQLVATKEDFAIAKALYESLGGHDRDKYSESEEKVLQSIQKIGTATQADIQKDTNLSAGRVSDILNGRKDGDHGLLYKCKGLIVTEGRPKRYALSPGFILKTEVVVDLADDPA